MTKIKDCAVRKQEDVDYLLLLEELGWKGEDELPQLEDVLVRMYQKLTKGK